MAKIILSEQVKCPKCGTVMKLSDDERQEGETVTCPKCEYKGSNKTYNPVSTESTPVKAKKKTNPIVVIILVLLACGVISALSSPSTEKKEESNTPTTATTGNTTPTPSAVPTLNMTVSQKNAVKSAKSYLNTGAFSYEGLIKQLEFEQYPHADAVFAVDNCGANWNEQAAKSAKSYLNTGSFSRGSLIQQLKFEKFTQAQAEYGADAVGLK